MNNSQIAVEYNIVDTLCPVCRRMCPQIAVLGSSSKPVGVSTESQAEIYIQAADEA